MPIAPPATSGPPLESSGPPPAQSRRRVDLSVALITLALSLWVTGGLWLDPTGRAITVNSSDQALFEWLLSYGAHALTHGENPFFTHLLNVPHGVNLAVNTSVTAYAALFAPLTYLIGAPSTFLVVLTLNLAATAFAWYLLLSRTLVRRPLAALVGGLFIGFSPGMVSHANAHLNWSAGWLVPLILWRVLRLRQPGRWLPNGAVLGVLVAVAFSIAAEGLFFTALACGVFLVAWALHPVRRAEARDAAGPFLRGLAVTAAVASALLAYPLYLHFFGPQRFGGTGFDPRVHSEDIAAYGDFPARSLAGVAGLHVSWAPNPTEENSFFGLPLLALAIACLMLLWRHADGPRRATLRALAVTAAVFTVLSWGPRIKIFGLRTDIPLPYAAISHLPLFNAALPARLALVVAPVIGILLAFTVEHLAANPLPRRTARNWVAGFAAALVPLVPVPLLTVQREPIPQFITSGAWRDYVRPGGVLSPVPFTLDVVPDGQRWQAYALTHHQGEFAIPAGFFLGPGGKNGRGRIGPVPRYLDQVLLEVARSGNVPTITETDRQQARADLRYWHVQVLVLADQMHGAKWPVHEKAVLWTVKQLLGTPERVQDVWLWPAPAGGW